MEGVQKVDDTERQDIRVELPRARNFSSTSKSLRFILLRAVPVLQINQTEFTNLVRLEPKEQYAAMALA